MKPYILQNGFVNKLFMYYSEIDMIIYIVKIFQMLIHNIKKSHSFDIGVFKYTRLRTKHALYVNSQIFFFQIICSTTQT